MRKRVVELALGALLLALSVPVEAQQQAKMPKIGWLGAGSGSAATPSEIFRREFRALGYVEGKTVTIEFRYAENKLERLPTLLDELVRLKVDVILTPGINEALAAKNATKTIPIVVMTGADPVALGLVDSLARPGGNVTGFTTVTGVLTGKRLELLKETIPKLSRLAVLWNPKADSSAQQWKESQLPARELGLQLHSMEVSSADKFESAFKEAVKAGNAALAVTQNALYTNSRKQIAELAAKNRVPAIFPRRDYAESGGLMSYGADLVHTYKRAAIYVDRILKGTKPADLPVEQPVKFEFIINLKAAKQIGLTIPPNVLVRADRVIK